MGIPLVLYDACVLYPAPLRDLLMHLVRTKFFRPRWTEAIHDEWIRNLLKNRPDLKPEQLARTRELMNKEVSDGLITNYEEIIAGLTLPDPDDRHVLAAAIVGRCEIIVTCNLADFPQATLRPHGIEVQPPDTFVTNLLNLDSSKVCAAVKRQREKLRNPPQSVGELLATLERQGLTQTVAHLRGVLELL